MKAGVTVDRELLEQLFDVLGEKYNENADKYLAINYFVGKIFSEGERREISEVDQTIARIKTCLIYKGLDFSILFAEHDAGEKDGKKVVKSE